MYYFLLFASVTYRTHNWFLPHFSRSENVSQVVALAANCRSPRMFMQSAPTGSYLCSPDVVTSFTPLNRFLTRGTFSQESPPCRTRKRLPCGVDVIQSAAKYAQGADRVIISCEQLPRGRAISPSKRRVCVQPCRAAHRTSTVRVVFT